MSSSALIGIDIGTSSAKGVAVDPASGRVIAMAEFGYPVSSPAAGLDRAASRRVGGGDRGRCSTASGPR